MMMMTEMTEKCVISQIRVRKKYEFFREISICHPLYPYYWLMILASTENSFHKNSIQFENFLIWNFFFFGLNIVVKHLVKIYVFSRKNKGLFVQDA